MTISLQSVAKRCTTRQSVALPCNAMLSKTTGLKHGRKISPLLGGVMRYAAVRCSVLRRMAEHSIATPLARKGQKLSFLILAGHCRVMQCFARLSTAPQGMALHCAPVSPLRKGRKISLHTSAMRSRPVPGSALRGTAGHSLALLLPSPLCAEKDFCPARHGNAAPSEAMPPNAQPTRASLCSAIHIPSSEGTDFLSCAFHRNTEPSSARLCAACRSNAGLRYSIPSQGGKDFQPSRCSAHPSHRAALLPMALPCVALRSCANPFPAQTGNSFYESN